MARLTLAALAAAAVLSGADAASWDVQVVAAPDQPVISFLEGNTAWPQSFNPSWVQASPGTGGVSGLLVRSQNCTGVPPGHCIGCNVHSVGADAAESDPSSSSFVGSVISFAKARGDGTFEPPYLVFAPLQGAVPDESYGTEDPRLAYDASSGQYHLFYTCYGKGGPFLCHATTADPTAPYPGQWTRHGAVFPNLPQGTKSGALLVRPTPPHYLYWGAGVIALATSDDLLTFTNVNTSFITKRPSMFDNQLVEAGPPPLPLSDGNLIFFHNSDNTTSDPRAGFGSYNPGWVILNGADPTQILARSAVPLLSPSHGWEQGVAPYACNVHNVTFLEAAAPVANQPDTFDVWFGGADTVIGTARVKVTIGA